jgi:hypothetical protein
VTLSISAWIWPGGLVAESGGISEMPCSRRMARLIDSALSADMAAHEAPQK